jgi:hypothetical protein
MILLSSSFVKGEIGNDDTLWRISPRCEEDSSTTFYCYLELLLPLLFVITALPENCIRRQCTCMLFPLLQKTIFLCTDGVGDMEFKLIPILDLID